LRIPLADLLLIPVWSSVVSTWRVTPHGILLSGLGVTFVEDIWRERFCPVLHLTFIISYA
jgi:hypothetical protein